MARLNARELVNHLLEYGIDPDGPRPGSPDDPWRAKHAFKPLKFGQGDFEGKRPEAGSVPIKMNPAKTGPAKSEPLGTKINKNRDEILELIHRKFVKDTVALGVPPDEAERRWASYLNKLETGTDTGYPARFFWKPEE